MLPSRDTLVHTERQDKKARANGWNLSSKMLRQIWLGRRLRQV